MADVIRDETGIDAQLIRSRGGAFEVTFDGELIYSKLRTGSFPDQRDILSAVWERDPAARRD